LASLGTEQNRFGQKTDEIAKFSILGGKTEFTVFNGIWTKNYRTQKAYMQNHADCTTIT